jgi:1,4-alpha-glucan branching enzyme
MPISNVKEDVEWGYTPLGYFAPDDRLGGPAALKRLVDVRSTTFE